MQYAMAILVVSVVLPQMQGSLSATQDEIAWVMTFNILATAVMTPMSGWLAARFGRRQVMLGSMAGFTVATLFCGLATNLPLLVLFRIAQGAFGAPLIPLGQAVILDTFPKHQHGVATSVIGMAVVVGPVIVRLDYGIVLSAATAGANLVLGLYLIRIGRRAGSTAI